ncbi:MAG: MBL fold metallo-hydrolase [Actinomycetota bacterium]
MPTLLRRTSRPLLALLAAIALVATACGSDDETTDASGSATGDGGSAETSDGTSFEPGTLASGATIERFDADGVTVHTYTNTEAGFGNTTTVIESDNAVVLIDAHFGAEPAAEFRALAESLGKPIDRLLITHEHPDHIGGIEPVFSDVESASSAGVVEAVAAAGTTITSVIEPGETEIDGIAYQIDVFADAEADEQIVITLPDHGVMLIGDLVYNDYHMVMSPTFDNWLSILDTLRATDGLELVIPGHGPPGGPEIIDEGIDYLTTAQSAFADNGDADSFNAAMIDAYPDHLGANLLDFGRLYGG